MRDSEYYVDKDESSFPLIDSVYDIGSTSYQYKEMHSRTYMGTTESVEVSQIAYEYISGDETEGAILLWDGSKWSPKFLTYYLENFPYFGSFEETYHSIVYHERAEETYGAYLNEDVYDIINNIVKRIMPKNGQNPRGPLGPKGYIGAQGIPGIRGDTGPKGDIGPQGNQGARGLQGIRGDRGEKGDAGEIGLDGLRGPKGQEGDPGDPGSDGDKGPTGDKGNNGEQGRKGNTGPKGATGSKGETGPKGEKGDQGEQGDKGPTGPRGEKGPTGSMGEPGPSSAGPSGPTGAQGIKGQIGPRGPIGDQGEKGVQGPPGASGVSGPKGPEGFIGETGPTGYPGTVTGTDYRLDYGMDLDHTMFIPISISTGRFYIVEDNVKFAIDSARPMVEDYPDDILEYYPEIVLQSTQTSGVRTDTYSNYVKNTDINLGVAYYVSGTSLTVIITSDGMSYNILPTSYNMNTVLPVIGKISSEPVVAYVSSTRVNLVNKTSTALDITFPDNTDNIISLTYFDDRFIATTSDTAYVLESGVWTTYPNTKDFKYYAISNGYTVKFSNNTIWRIDDKSFYRHSTSNLLEFEEFGFMDLTISGLVYFKGRYYISFKDKRIIAWSSNGYDWKISILVGLGQYSNGYVLTGESSMSYGSYVKGGSMGGDYYNSFLVAGVLDESVVGDILGLEVVDNNLVLVSKSGMYVSNDGRIFTFTAATNPVIFNNTISSYSTTSSLFYISDNDGWVKMPMPFNNMDTNSPITSTVTVGWSNANLY